jgi:hypothetical protein
VTARAPVAVLALGAAALAALLGGILALLAAKTGPLALVLPGLLVASIGLALVPKATAVIAVVAVALLEADPAGFLGGYSSRFYEALPAMPLRPHEVLLMIAAGGLALERARSRRPIATPGAMTLPLLALSVAALCGVVVGDAADASTIDLLNGLRSVLTLALVPFLIVNLIETRRELMWVLGATVVVVAIKTVFGGVAWVIGAGRVIEGTVLTYYGPLPNLLLMAFVLGVLAAVMRGADVPRVVRWLAPLALVVLILGVRRNFWIAVVLGAVLVLLVAVGARGRLLLIPAATLLAISLWFGFTALSASQSDSPVVQRAQSLSPSRVQANAQDRYRLDEQRNVRAEIARHPVLGIGLGVPWTARYPLAQALPGGRQYTHVVLFWYWLKLGLLGVLAYVAIMATAVWAGLRVWRTDPDLRVQAAGLGLAAAVIGLVVAETTGSFSGVEPRASVLLAVMLGWLAAAQRLTRLEDGGAAR